MACRSRQRRRARFSQHKHRQQADHHPHANHRVEQTLPRVFEHNQVPQHRCEYRHDAGDTVKQRQHLGPQTIVERIAQDSERHDVATASPDPLNKTPHQEGGAAFRQRTDSGSGDVDQRPDNRYRLAARLVRHFPGEQHRGCHPGQIDRKRNVQLRFAGL